MKIHMVVLYLYLMILVTNGAEKKSGGKLTPEENEQRLTTCGMTGIDTPSSDNKAKEVNEWPKWMSFAVTRYQNGSGAALATMISPRHFLTSSQVVMHDISYTWRWNSTIVESCRKIRKENLEVPKQIVENIGLYKSRSSRIDVIRAVILNYCRTSPRMWKWSQAVMVMEIAEDVGGGFPCLTYDTQQNGEKLDVYSYLWKGKYNQSIYHRKLPLLNSNEMSYQFPRYNEVGERGSPVMKKESTGKWALVGLGGRNASEKETGVLRMSWVGGELCREVGVCAPPKTKKTNPPPVKQVPIVVKPIPPTKKPKTPTVPIRKLTDAENVRRLQTCGKTPIDTPSRDNNPKVLEQWPHWVSLARTSQQNGSGTALTTMISPRHFLTSSQVVMDKKTDIFTWRWNSKSVEERCKEMNGRVNLEVPEEIVQNIRFFESGKNSTIPVTRAVILDYCDKPFDVKVFAQGVMVMEIAEDISGDGGFPCLADKTTDGEYRKGRELDMYSYVPENRFINHRKFSITGIIIPRTSGFLTFPLYPEEWERGGPIMDNVNGTWTLVGMGGGRYLKDSAAFQISALQEHLCEVVGVCYLKDVPPPKAPESTPATTEMPSKSPEAAPPPPTPPPEPSSEAPPPRAPPARKPESDEDDPDYETYLQRKKEKEEAEMYENEDTDILISKDDLDDGTRPQLWITVFIIAFLVFV